MDDLVRVMINLVEDLELRLFTFALLRNVETIASFAINDFCVHFCSSFCLTAFSHPRTIPLSSGEHIRTKRALLRFQLCAQLFHQPESTDEVVSDRDWERRPHQQQYFSTRFTSVGVDERKCVYVLLVYALSYIRSFQPLSSSIPCLTQSNQRGLSLLYPILSNSGFNLRGRQSQDMI